MAGQLRAGTVECGERFLRQIAAQRERRIYRRAAVSLGQHEAVAFVPIRLLGVDAHGVEIQHREQFAQIDRTADMPGGQFANLPDGHFSD